MTSLQHYAAAGVPGRQFGRIFRDWSEDSIRTILNHFDIYHRNVRKGRGRNKLEMLRKLDRVTKEHKLTEAEAHSIMSGRGLNRPVSSKKSKTVPSTTPRSHPPPVTSHRARTQLHQQRRHRVPRRPLTEAQTARNGIPRRPQPLNAAVPKPTFPRAVSQGDNALSGRVNHDVTISDYTTSVNSSNASEGTHKTSNERECIVCMESLPLLDFPVRNITSSCSHTPDVCAPCLSQSIATQLSTKTWNNINCPTCNQRLDYAAVKKFADNATFEKYVSMSVHVPQVELIVTIGMIISLLKLV